ncbi:beta strand repeat-containing protein [Verrucomicrobiota bacterium sgz303538]
MKTAKLSTLSTVEPLEARIAPATLTFVDIDGDEVTITTSKGSNADLAAAVNPFLVDSGAGKQLQKIDLASNPVFHGTNLSITAQSGALLSSVDVGYIDATGIDLGKVIVHGDVGQIDAGDSKVSSYGIKSLEVYSLGALGTTTQGPNASLVSSIKGSVSTFVCGTSMLGGDLKGTFDVSGGEQEAAGRIRNITIYGSLKGGDQPLSGSISASGAIGSVVINGSLEGGTAANSGYISGASFRSIFVNHDIIGGDGEFSGSVRSRGDIVEVNVNGNVTGGLATTANHSGEIRAGGTIKNVSVTGFIKGGGGENSGAIGAATALGTIKVDGGITGGEGLESGTLGSKGTVNKVVIGTGLTGGGGERSGSVLATAKIVDVTINGGLTGGDGNQSGVIATEGALQKVTINGSLKGGQGEESGAIGSRKTLNTVFIQGNVEGGDGVHSGTILSSTSIGSVTVGGSVKGGTQYESGAIGSLGVVGSVKIGGDLEGLSGDYSGTIVSSVSLPKIDIDGSIKGGAGFNSGGIRSFGSIGSVDVQLDLEGGAESSSGSIFAERSIQSISIHGSIVGGDRSFAGSIFTHGTLSRATIDGDLKGGTGFASGIIEGVQISRVEIGGSIIGFDGTQSGVISAISFSSEGLSNAAARPSVQEAALGTIIVRGDVAGGNGPESGSILSSGRIGAISIGTKGSGEVSPQALAPGQGSLRGGVGSFSGNIRAQGNIGSIDIVRDIAGGTGSGNGIIAGDHSGSIFAGGNLDRVTVGRDVFGGDGYYGSSSEGGSDGGQIFASGRIGSAKVGGYLFGGLGDYSATIQGGSISSVSIGGSVRAGTGAYSASILANQTDIAKVQIVGQIITDTGITGPDGESILPGGFHSGSISAARNIGTIEAGALNGTFETRVQITAGGVVGARTDAQALSIRSVSTKGGMAYTDILAGYGVDGTALNPDAQIGTVQVGAAKTTDGNWRFNNVVAGCTAGFDGRFGSFDDSPISSTTNTPSVLSKIARIVVTGSMDGRSEGIVAELVGSLTINNHPNTQLTPGPRNDFFTVAQDTSEGTTVNEPTGEVEIPR